MGRHRSVPGGNVNKVVGPVRSCRAGMCVLDADLAEDLGDPALRHGLERERPPLIARLLEERADLRALVLAQVLQAGARARDPARYLRFFLPGLHNSTVVPPQRALHLLQVEVQTAQSGIQSGKIAAELFYELFHKKVTTPRLHTVSRRFFLPLGAGHVPTRRLLPPPFFFLHHARLSDPHREAVSLIVGLRGPVCPPPVPPGPPRLSARW